MRQKVSGVAITHVMFKDVATSSLESYAQDAHVLDKAGAYDFEDVGCVFIKQITGDFYNAIGMPLSDIADAVASFGVDVV
jgi:septum formation protein